MRHLWRQHQHQPRQLRSRRSPRSSLRRRRQPPRLQSHQPARAPPRPRRARQQPRRLTRLRQRLAQQLLCWHRGCWHRRQRLAQQLFCWHRRHFHLCSQPAHQSSLRRQNPQSPSQQQPRSERLRGRRSPLPSLCMLSGLRPISSQLRSGVLQRSRRKLNRFAARRCRWPGCFWTVLAHSGLSASAAIRLACTSDTAMNRKVCLPAFHQAM